MSSHSLTRKAFEMTEIKNEILPETNKLYKTQFLYTIEKFMHKLNIVSRLDFEISGLTTWWVILVFMQHKLRTIFQFPATSRFIRVSANRCSPVPSSPSSRFVSIHPSTTRKSLVKSASRSAPRKTSQFGAKDSIMIRDRTKASRKNSSITFTWSRTWKERWVGQY